MNRAEHPSRQFQVMTLVGNLTHLAKGRAIAVTGRLICREWVADDGTRRSKHAVVGHVQFGGRPNDEQPSDSDHTDDHQASF
jgi:single-stranded DNA-binding protein